MIKYLSDTIQEFEGERFYLCGFYFQRKAVRLHRVVWETVHGPIPEGCHVHHVDDDRSNNEPENLELMTAADHARLHDNRPKGFTDDEREAAAEWHRSPAGRAQHAVEYEARREALQRKTIRNCEVCGEAFSCNAVLYARFCGGTCRARSRRVRLRNL